jgi:phage terminase small subunit
MAKLTAKQQRFVDEYLIDLNATQAAIRAGYSVQTAKEIAAQNLSKLNISEEISRKMAERSKRTGVTADRIVLELARIAFLNISDVTNMADATVRDDSARDDLAAIASVKIKSSQSDSGESVDREVKTYDKIRALELLGKHLGMFRDKVELSGSLDTQKNLLDDMLIQLRGDVDG